MSDFKHRGEKPNGFSFWTNQLLGHQINGIQGPSLNVSSSDSGFNSPISFTHVGDSGDEGREGLTAKDLFLNFITHPKVHDTAINIIYTKLGSIAAIQITNFIARETYGNLAMRPSRQRDPLDGLRSILQSDAPKN